jgi:hypothetical protein
MNLDVYGNAISNNESSGNYKAVGPVIPKTGDQAWGKYQVMGANVPVWTQKHLGRQLTPEEFLADPQAQEAVFKGEFGEYVKKYGPEGASRAWFAGEKNMNNPNAKDVLGTTVAGYSRKFMAGLPMQSAFAGETPVQDPIAYAQAQNQPILSAQSVNGPGALNQGGNALSNSNWGGLVNRDANTDMGNALERAAMHMRDSGTGALGALASMNKTKADPYDFIRGDNGQIFRVTKKTGQIVPVVGATPDKVDDGTIKQLGETTDRYAQMLTTSQRAAEFSEALKKGELDVSLLGGAGPAAVENLFGKSSPKTQQYNAFQAFGEQLVNNILMQHKGVQTDKDAERAGRQFADGLARRDNATVQSALDTLIEINGRATASGRTALDAYKTRYRNAPALAPFEKSFEEQNKFYTDRAAQRAQPQGAPPTERSTLFNTFFK